MAANNLTLLSKEEMIHLQDKINDTCKRKNISSKEISETLGITVAEVKQIKLGRKDVSPAQYVTLKSLFSAKGMYPIDSLLVGPLPEERGLPRLYYHLFIKGMDIVDFEKSTGVTIDEIKKLFKTGSIYAAKKQLLNLFSKEEYEAISGFKFLQLEPIDQEMLKHLSITTALNMYLDKGNKTLDQVMKESNTNVTMVNELFTKGNVSDDKTAHTLKKVCKSLSIASINENLLDNLDSYLGYFICREIYKKGSNLFDAAVDSGIGYKNLLKKLNGEESMNVGEIKKIFSSINSAFSYDVVEILGLSKEKFKKIKKTATSSASKSEKKFSPLRELFNSKLEEANLSFAELEKICGAKGGFAAALNNGYIPKKMLQSLNILQVMKSEVIHLIPEGKFRDWVHEYYGPDSEETKEAPGTLPEVPEEETREVATISMEELEKECEPDTPEEATVSAQLSKVDVEMFFETFNKLTAAEQLNLMKCMMNALGKDLTLDNPDIQGESVLSKLFRYNIVYNIILKRDDK